MFYVVTRPVIYYGFFGRRKYKWLYLKVTNQFGQDWVDSIEKATHYDEKEWAERMTGSIYESVLAVQRI